NARKPCKSGRERIAGSIPAASMIGLIPGVCGKERRGGSGDPGQATYRPFAREKGDLAYASATPSSRGSIVLRQRGRINDQDRSSCAAKGSVEPNARVLLDDSAPPYPGARPMMRGGAAQRGRPSD